MPRQLIPIENQLTEKSQIRLTKATDNKIRAIAKRKFRSKSSVICEAIDFYLNSLSEKNDSILK
jgi:predicted DNA-binding protein